VNGFGEKFTTDETRYLHYDSLGSVDTITNQQGSVVQRTAYTPFGEQLELKKAPKSITNRGYTGHEHIEGTRFIHMNARLYDPTIGRFLSADTIIQDPYDSQSYNRYSYVRNNPMKYSDPTGHSWWTRHRYRILGTVSVIVGVLLIQTANVYAVAAGVAFLGLGQSLLNYDPNEPESQNNQISFSTSYSYNTSWGQSGGGLTANQQYTVNQGRRDTIQLQPYLDNLGAVQYVNGSSSGDIAMKNGVQYNNLSSYATIREREEQLAFALNLIVNATEVSEDVRKMFRNYMENYYIIYTDTPFFELTLGDKINSYNGVHHGDNFSGRTRNYRRNDGGKISYKVQGRGIEYSSLIWTHDGGYLSQNFIEVLFHEILHDKNLYGIGHSKIKDGMNLRERATSEANLFFKSYDPKLKKYR